jgi:hypothetical protein
MKVIDKNETQTKEVIVGQITIAKSDLYMITGALMSLGDWLVVQGLHTHRDRAKDYYDMAKRFDRLWSQVGYVENEPLHLHLVQIVDQDEEEVEDEHREEAENDKSRAAGEAAGTQAPDHAERRSEPRTKAAGTGNSN